MLHLCARSGTIDTFSDYRYCILLGCTSVLRNSELRTQKILSSNEFLVTDDKKDNGSFHNENINLIL